MQHPTTPVDAVPALSVRGLTRSFGSRVAVNGLHLDILQGDLYGFLGPNGAGKTTAIRCILGLIQRDAGEIAFFGETHPVRQRRGVGAMVETPRFHDWLSARTNLRISAAYTGRVDDDEIALALERVGLADRAEDRVRGYSQGMRQRLGIARALLGRPRLLLLDEPTNGLDPRGMKEVRDLLRMLVRRDGLTVFVSSHLLSEVEALCNRVGILDQGHLVAEGPVAELLREMVTLDDVEIGFDDPGRGRETLDRMEGVTVLEDAESGRILVRLRGRTIAELNRDLVQAGVAVRALLPRTPRLEDLYLERTRKEVR